MSANNDLITKINHKVYVKVSIVEECTYSCGICDNPNYSSLRGWNKSCIYLIYTFLDNEGGCYNNSQNFYPGVYLLRKNPLNLTFCELES